ncbi:hypothetical protein [Paenibacillus agricola]|uniref:Uncharacterized protein n=1 Tax=Paenibacillus agricola TaxID=2716264 RepID=A0ABX0JK14_9BACL|nr:hypothetical protein [Paenibacillus agricola]NHN34200.1 hypothetical protein [Paenibacillus agricola]
MKMNLSKNLISLDEDITEFQTHLLNELEISSAFTGVLNNISEIVRACNTDDFGKNRIHEIRNELAQLRLKLRKCCSLFDKDISISVEAYRSALVDQKDAFEKLADSEQKIAHPQAYDALQRFRKLTILKDMSQKISDGIMDLSSEIEHQHLQQIEFPPIGHYELESNAPSTSSLSP